MNKRLSKSGEKPAATRKRAAENLDRGIRSMLIEASPDALIALTPNGIILYWSKGAESVYGYNKKEAVGKRLGELVASSELSDESEELARAAVDQGLAVKETVHRRKDGSVIYVDITAKAVRNQRGDLKLIAASHKDVTQLKVLNHGKMLEARYRGLLESMPDAIVVVNQTGRIVLVNGQAEGLFGYGHGDLLGKPIEVLLPARFRDGHIGHRTRYFAEPKTRTMGAGLELFATHANGGEFPVEISLSPLTAKKAFLR